jgi:hypothetical protein
VAERIREADAMVLLVAINLEGELKPRATAEGLAWAAADSVAAAEAAADSAAAVEVAAEVVAEAEAVVVVEAVVVAEAVDDDASWAIGSPELFVIGTC